MRRAQFEAIGLAIIVILISVIIFFALAVSLNPDTNPVSQVEDEQFNQNFLDALLKTNLDGCRGTIKDYFVALDYDDDTYTKYPTPLDLPITNDPADQPACATSEGWYRIEEAIADFITDYNHRPFRLEVRKDKCPSLVGPACEEYLQTFYVYNPTEHELTPGLRSHEDAAIINTGCDPGAQQANRAGRQLIPLYPRPGSLEIVLWVCEPRQF